MCYSSTGGLIHTKSDAVATKRLLYETYYNYSVAPGRLMQGICDIPAIRRLISETFDSL